METSESSFQIFLLALSSHILLVTKPYQPVIMHNNLPFSSHSSTYVLIQAWTYTVTPHRSLSLQNISWEIVLKHRLDDIPRKFLGAHQYSKDRSWIFSMPRKLFSLPWLYSPPSPDQHHSFLKNKLFSSLSVTLCTWLLIPFNVPSPLFSFMKDNFLQKSIQRSKLPQVDTFLVHTYTKRIWTYHYCNIYYTLSWTGFHSLIYVLLSPSQDDRFPKSRTDNVPHLWLRTSICECLVHSRYT
jgi:hypothetical protein